MEIAIQTFRIQNFVLQYNKNMTPLTFTVFEFLNGHNFIGVL